MAALGQGDWDLIVSMWRSMLNHVCDVHEGHEGPFAECLHKPLEDREWIERDSPAHLKLRAILDNPRLLSDLRQLSSTTQTSSLESFNNLLIRFAPKSIAYSRDGMEARTRLAVLHYNENASRPQARTRKGAKRFKVKMPRGRKGHFTVAAVKRAPTFDYVRGLLGDVVARCSTTSLRTTISESSTPREHFMTTGFKRPSTDQLVEAHYKRFRSST